MHARNINTNIAIRTKNEMGQQIALVTDFLLFSIFLWISNKPKRLVKLSTNLKEKKKKKGQVN